MASKIVQWSEHPARPLLKAVLLGVLAAIANALLGRPDALGAVALGTAPALVALSSCGAWPGGIAALLAASGLLFTQPDPYARAGLHLVELTVIFLVATRVRSLILASAVFWLALTPFAWLSGAGARGTVAGLLGAGIAEAVNLIWPRSRPSGTEAVPLWIEVLPRSMLIVVVPLVVVAGALAYSGAPPMPSLVVAILAGLLSALALKTTADSISHSLRNMTSAMGQPAEQAKRLPTRSFGPIRELREFVSAMNTMRESVAYRDSATGLPNRRLLEDRLAVAMARGEPTPEPFALFHVDLDRFRLVDNSLGREAAEALLALVARRLETRVQSGDTVARVGDDEFALVRRGVSNLEQAENFAVSVMDTIKRPFTVSEKEVFLTATVGIGLFPRDGATPDALLHNARAATHVAKQRGQDSFRRYTERVSAREIRRLAIETGLRRALETDALALHFQPVVDTKSGRVVAAEALLRWRAKDGTSVSPSEFIPVAESSGFIQSVDLWVLRAACSALRHFADNGVEIPISINVSPRQFQQPELGTQITEALATWGIPPARLGLEITERTALQDFERSVDTLRGLRGLGVKIALDDFGTGYSSLSYLSRLPLDVVKLDGSFVRAPDNRPDDAAIASAVIAMSHSLGLRVVAEGVETQGQLRFLARLGCEGIQGFLCSPAVPPDHLLEILRRDEPLFTLD